MKELIDTGFKMGYDAFPEIGSAPCLNGEFMQILPKCNFSDDKVTKLRIKMMKSYIKGWTKAHLDKEWNIDDI